MSLLITGGAGYIGSHVNRLLAIRVAQRYRVAYQPVILSRSRQQKNSLSVSYSDFCAFRDLYALHESTIRKYPYIDAAMLYSIGNACMRADIREARGYFGRSLSVQKRIKPILKYLYCSMKLIGA